MTRFPRGWAVARLPLALTRIALTLGALTLAAPPAAAGHLDHAQGQEGGDSNLATREFPIHHQNPESLARILGPLGSGQDGTFVDHHKKRRLVTARDSAEYLDAIEKALRGLDLPSPVQPHIDVDIRLFVTTAEAGTKLPAEMARILSVVRTQLRAKGLLELATIRDRIDQGEGLKREGRVTSGPATAQGVRYNVRLENVRLRQAAGKFPSLVSVNRIKLWADGEGFGEAEFGTSVSAREGDAVVVGTVPVKGATFIVVFTGTQAK